MDWIKKNPHHVALAASAVVLIAASALIILNTQSFGEKFTATQTSPTPSTTVPPLPLEPLKEAQAELTDPKKWVPDAAKNGSLFVADRYLVGPDGKVNKPGETELHKYSITGESIPSPWFLDNNLPLLDPTVPKQDPDGDGFFNEDEWKGGTDPNDAKAHPPYHTKLFVGQWIRVPFRLKFQAYDGDPAKPESMTFQINAIDLRQPTEFLQIGQQIANTKFKLESFAKKTVMNPNIGVEEDVSELTLRNVETNDAVSLILNKITDSPDSFALFGYYWPQPPKAIRVKKLSEFTLPPANEKYKLVDIKEGVAKILLPSGQEYTVPAIPQSLLKQPSAGAQPAKPPAQPAPVQ
jgi:hypothetical protein